MFLSSCNSKTLAFELDPSCAATGLRFLEASCCLIFTVESFYFGGVLMGML